MKVSIVLTTYNRGYVLPVSIETILSQTYSDFELIITDNCSTDNTEDICRKYEKQDSRIRYRRNKRNLGMPGNLNAGILDSSGEYIANLHDGDIYAPTLIEKWTLALDTYPNAAFVFNAYRALDAKGNERVVYREPLPPCSSGTVLLKQIFFKRWRFDSPVWGTAMARRSAYEKVGLFDERFGFYSDVDMWMRLAEQFDVAYIDKPLISLASRETVPRLFDVGPKDTMCIVTQMFWKARIRHYKKRPFRLIAEVIRHTSFVVASKTWTLILKMRRRLLNFPTK